MYFFYRTNYKYINLEPLIEKYDKKMNLKPNWIDTFYTWIKFFLFFKEK